MGWLSARCFAPLLHVLLLLQGLKETLAADQDENYLEKCCSLGSSWANQQQRCESFAAPVPGISESEQAACLETIDICCRKSFQEQSCREGKARARASKSCTGLDDYRRGCCEGCKLGILTGGSGKGCAFKRINLGIPWDPAYMECCLEVLSSTTAIQDSTSSSSQSILGSMAATDADSSESDELDFDLDATDPTETVTFKTDDLCKLMKGLLCSEICVPTPGSYYCKCFEGSVLLEDGRTCKSNTSTTNGESTFTTNALSASAKPRSTRSLPVEDNELNESCPEGFRFSPESSMCDDIDECAEGIHNCAGRRCFNLPGTYQCVQLPRPIAKKKSTTTSATSTTRSKASSSVSTRDGKCQIGSRYDTTRGGCIDINECEELEDACSSNEECVNSAGSYKCNCLTGFYRDELTQACVDMNECLLENECLPSQRCDNTIGSYSCIRFLSCGTGYTLNSATENCEDDDECSLGTHDCGPGYHCRNTLGSFRCDKDRRTDGKSVRPTFKSIVTSTTASTVPSTVATSTSPRPTYKSPPPSKAMTTTRITASTARTISTGSVGYSTTARSIRPTTRPTPRSTTVAPYTTTSTTTTEEIPTVASLPTTSHVSKPNTVVAPTRTLPIAVCPNGYSRDRFTGVCKDANECAEGTHKCKRDQKCENRIGGYVCFCPKGYEINRENECVDVNECSLVPDVNICGRNSRCVNTLGSYRCVCEAGYENDGAQGACRDVDECLSRAAHCQQECSNTWGGYRCHCRFGFRLKPDNHTCEDIDECAEYRDSNLCVGICDNTPGSYICRCPSGYRLGEDARTCQDINECEDPTLCRGPGNICQNVRGGYRCNKINCPAGYVLDPQRKNRCMRESPFCPAADRACFLRPSHYTYNYIAIVSMYPIPASGQLDLFTMRGAYSLSSTMRFSMAFIQSRAPPHVMPATESCFAMRKPTPTQAVLVLKQSLQGPQDIELEFSMEIYDPSGSFVGSAVAKIFIIVTQYEF